MYVKAVENVLLKVNNTQTLVLLDFSCKMKYFIYYVAGPVIDFSVLDHKIIER